MSDKKQTTNQPTFTPLFDELVEQGFSLAERAIYGQIWRYSQLSEGRCTATLETMAKNIGVSKKTVVRALASLKEHGLVVDLTPEIKNHYHRRVVVQSVQRDGQPQPGNASGQPGQPAAVEPSEPQNALLDGTQAVLNETICLTPRTDCPTSETICPEIETDCPAVETICPAQRVNLTPEDTIKETLQERIQGTKLREESLNHYDDGCEPFFYDSQWIAAEINFWFEEADADSERKILNLLKKYDRSLMNHGWEVNGREIIVEFFDWAAQKAHMTLRKALGCVNKSIATWELEYRYRFANGDIYRINPDAGSPCEGAAPDTPFGAMRALVEKVTGYPQTVKDREALIYFVENGVTQADLCAALAFFQERGRQVYGAAQLLNSVKFQLARRTQKEYAQEAQTRPMRTLRDVNGKEIQVPA